MWGGGFHSHCCIPGPSSPRSVIIYLALSTTKPVIAEQRVKSRASGSELILTPSTSWLSGCKKCWAQGLGAQETRPFSVLACSLKGACLSGPRMTLRGHQCLSCFPGPVRWGLTHSELIFKTMVQVIGKVSFFPCGCSFFQHCLLRVLFSPLIIFAPSSVHQLWVYLFLDCVLSDDSVCLACPNSTAFWLW